MKIILWIFLGLVAWTILGLLLRGMVALVWQLLLPKSYYLYSSSTSRGKNTKKHIMKIFQRYGEQESKKLIIEYLEKRLIRVTGPIFRHQMIEKKEFDNQIRKFNIFMLNLIEALRDLGLSKKLFPELKELLEVHCIFQPSKVTQISKTFDGLNEISSHEEVIDNSMFEVIQERLKDLNNP